LRLKTWSAMAATAMRTLGNVKSSAMMPRQPEVPNFMGEAAILFCAGPYCILAAKIDRNKAHARKQKVTGREGEWRDAMPKKSAGKYVVVLVTCGSRAEAQRIAREIVLRRLAACANLLEMPVQSVYRWKGKVEKAREFLLLVKTSARRLPALQAEVERLHSYDVPEFIALPIVAGSPKYMAWLGECVNPEDK
jgi:periplasmic divalent cation tolerance protein